MASKQRKCYKCAVELVNEKGIHMGISFARHPRGVVALVCSPCYDKSMVDPDTKEQRTGEEVV